MINNTTADEGVDKNYESSSNRIQPSPPEQFPDRPIAELFEILADHRSRYVLSYLKNTYHKAASRDELASHISTQDPDSAPEERIAIALHHTVLPKLEDAELLEYDSQDAFVQYCGHPKLESRLAETGNWE